MEMKRMRKFLSELDDIIMDCCYYDEDLQTEVFTETEDDVYRYIMETDEFHWLGTEKVKKFIHIFMTDWKLASEIRYAFKIM